VADAGVDRDGYRESYGMGLDDDGWVGSASKPWVRSTADRASLYRRSAAFSCSAVRYCGTGGFPGDVAGDTFGEGVLVRLGLDTMALE
jgi:hypothetical protein